MGAAGGAHSPAHSPHGVEPNLDDHPQVVVHTARVPVVVVAQVGAGHGQLLAEALHILRVQQDQPHGGL
jgi:hypothetical protein